MFKFIVNLVTNRFYSKTARAVKALNSNRIYNTKSGEYLKLSGVSTTTATRSVWTREREEGFHGLILLREVKLLFCLLLGSRTEIPE